MAKKNKRKQLAQKEIPLIPHPQKNWFSNIPLPLEEKKLTFWETVFTYLIFFTVFLLYFFTLAPSVPTGDSGELIASAYTLGIPHPPGYPLFNIMGKLFSYIPFGSIAWRVNLSSAVFNLLASVFIYLTLFKIIKYWPAAILGAVFFSTSPIIWEFSLKAEVFAINNFLAALILYLIVCSRALYLQNQAKLLTFLPYQAKSRRILYATLFVCGLALTDHQTIILFAPSVLLALFFYQSTNLRNPITITLALGAFIMGLAVLLYIPIRARTHPYLSWDNPETLDSFLALVLRKDYGSLKFMNVQGETYTLLQKYGIYFFSLIKQFTPVGVFLAILGACFTVSQKDKKLGIVFLLAYVLSSFFFICLANVIRGDRLYLFVFERFYMMPSVIVALFIGLGIYCVHQKILEAVSEHRKKISAYLINGFITFIILIAASFNYSKVNQRNYNIDYHLGLNILNALEKNAIFLTYGDVINDVMLYMQRVENIRTDVTVIDTAMLTYPWHVAQLKRTYPEVDIPFERFTLTNPELMSLIKRNIKTHPIYINPYYINGELNKNYQLIPFGVVKQLVKKGISLNPEDYLKKNTALWKEYDIAEVKGNYLADGFEDKIKLFYATSASDLAFKYNELGFVDEALRAYKQAIYIHGSSVPLAYKNTAIIYYNTKHETKPAAHYFKKYIQMVPEDKEKDMILAFISQYGK